MTQADYNYKLKGKIKVPCLWICIPGSELLMTWEAAFFVFPIRGFYRKFYFKSEDKHGENMV